MKRYLILLLILTLTLASCTAQVGGALTHTGATETTVPEAEVGAVAVEYTALEALPGRDMDGANLVITAAKSGDFASAGHYMYDAALAARNTAIGEKYNASVAVTGRDAASMYTELSSALSTGTFYSDLVAIPMSEVGRFARNGLLSDLSAMEGIDLSAEYFVGTDAFTDRGKTYAYMCESVSAGYGYCVFFNAHLAAERGIDFYSMVADGTWTWAKFAELVSDMPATGYTYGDAEQLVNAIVSSCGLTFSTLTEGVRSVDYTGETFDGILAQATAVFKNAGNARSDDPAALFGRGGCLFYVAPLYEAEKFAIMADSYGVLPLPTYAGGTDYKTYMSPDTPVLCIPAGSCASENAPYLLQAIAAGSEAELTDKYLLYMANFALHSEEAVLCAKLIEESAVYDYVYAFGPAHNHVANCTYWATQQAVINGLNHNYVYKGWRDEFEAFVN